MVGKTSILQRYIQGKFVKIDINKRTINTNCFNKKLIMNNMVFNLNIWDTAGEEKYHAMAPIFYRGADGAVVIFDFTRKETFERAEKWFKELSEFTDTNPRIILVGNKIDLPEKVVSYDDVNRLAQKYKVNFLEVSAVQGININEVFQSLTTSIYEQKLKLEQESEKIMKKEELKKNRKKTLNIVDTPEVSLSQKRKDSCC